MIRLAPAALALSALFASAPAFAAEPAEFATKLVSYADLNLANPADQARLERRIAGAARSVCATEDKFALARCKANARNKAGTQMQRAIARATSAERLATATGGAPIVGN